MAEEDQRSERYLHQTSFRKVRSTLEDVLISARLEDLYGEFQKLLTAQRIDDLQGLFQLVNRLDGGVVPIANQFRLHVTAAGQAKIQELGAEGFAGIVSHMQLLSLMNGQ